MVPYCIISPTVDAKKMIQPLHPQRDTGEWAILFVSILVLISNYLTIMYAYLISHTLHMLHVYLISYFIDGLYIPLLGKKQ